MRSFLGRSVNALLAVKLRAMEKFVPLMKTDNDTSDELSKNSRVASFVILANNALKKKREEQ